MCHTLATRCSCIQRAHEHGREIDTTKKTNSWIGRESERENRTFRNHRKPKHRINFRSIKVMCVCMYVCPTCIENIMYLLHTFDISGRFPRTFCCCCFFIRLRLFRRPLTVTFYFYDDRPFHALHSILAFSVFNAAISAFECFRRDIYSSQPICLGNRRVEEKINSRSKNNFLQQFP